MATKTDFTTEQWETLCYGVTDAMMLVSVANGPHFWESMSETTAAARYLVDQAKTSTSTLVRDLAMDAGHHRDKAANAGGEMESVTLDRVTNIVWRDVTNGVVRSFAFSYDSAGNITNLARVFTGTRSSAA